MSAKPDSRTHAMTTMGPYQQDIVKDARHVDRRHSAAVGRYILCIARSRWCCLLLLLLLLGIYAALQGPPGVLDHAGLVVRLDVARIAMPAGRTAHASATPASQQGISGIPVADTQTGQHRTGPTDCLVRQWIAYGPHLLFAWPPLPRPLCCWRPPCGPAPNRPPPGLPPRPPLCMHMPSAGAKKCTHASAPLHAAATSTCLRRWPGRRPHVRLIRHARRQPRRRGPSRRVRPLRRARPHHHGGRKMRLHAHLLGTRG